MARKSSTPRTLNLLREWNWHYWRVESYNAFSGKKSDLFNIIDYLVITDFSTIGIQSCGGDFNAHINKICIEEKEDTIRWLSSSHRKLILIGWRKVLKRRGMRLRIYKPRLAHIYLDGGMIICEEKETDFYGCR